MNVYYVGQAAETLKWYLLSIGSIFLALVLLPEFSSTRIKWLGWTMLGLVLFVDFRAVQTYDILYLKDYVAPVRLSSSMTTQAVLPDYQNPEILPLREFFNLETALPYPVVYPPCMYGAFNQFTTMGRFFRGWQIGEPRLMAYKDLYPDNEAQQYLIRNPRSIFFADYAFDSRYLRLSDILQYNVGQRVILVDAESFNKDLLKTTEHVYIPAMDFHPRFYQVSLDWKRAQVHQGAFGKEYSFDLPLDFPFYLSTTIFSYDYNSWQLTAARRILDPMQGELTRAYSYDVQNIKQKKLTILWPDGQVPAGDIKLQVKLPDRILNVWKNTNDDLGITFEAPKDGWIVFNYPYDSKWELIIDAKQVPISRVNRCFMGAPITQGKHQILMRYFPHTSVRFWIFLSMVLSIVCFFGIILHGIKRELFVR